MEHQYLEDDYLYEDEDALSQLRELRSKINYAKENGEIEKALFLYMDYVQCDVFRLYCKNAIKILPEFMELLDQHPEYYEHRINVMIGYKWVISAIDCFLWYSLDDLVDFYRQYHDLCLKYGYSLRTYYQFLWSFLENHTNTQDAFGLTVEEAHQKYRNEPVDRLSDRECIEAFGEISYALNFYDDEQKAFDILEPYLLGEKEGYAMPHHAYYIFAKHYYKKKDKTSMLKYAKLALEGYDKQFTDYNTKISTRSQLFLFISFRYPQKAIRIFKKILPYAPHCQSLYSRMVFYRSAYKMFVQLEKNDYPDLFLELPRKAFGDKIKSNGKYTVTELKKLFYDRAKSIAEKYDKRDCNTSHIDSLNEIICPE